MKRILFLTAASACGLCAQTPELHSTATIRSETRLVLVDSVVTDRKGNYVRDLTQKDFKVFEDNKEQTITSFSHEGGASEGDKKHYTVLFFDDTTAGTSLQTFARQAALKFIDSNTGPNKLMAVAELGAGLKMTQDFTEDAGKLKQVVANSQLSSTRVPENAAINDFTIRTAIGSLRTLIQGLAGLPGRKTLILVAGGYPATSTTINEITATIEACNRANVAVYSVVPTPVLAPGMDASGTADGASTTPVGRTRRGGANAGGRGDQADTSTAGIQQVLYTLANSSGGFVIDTTKDLSPGFEKIGQEPEEYYMLGYVPSKDAAPGICHTLKVKVDKGGDSVRSRSGYCETKTLDILSGTPTERDLEARMTSTAAPTVTGASVMAPYVYIAANTARVTAVLDIPAGAIQFSKDKSLFHAVVNLVGVAYMADGSVRSRFSDSVKVDLPTKKDVDAFMARPFHYEKQFRAPPGSYNFRLVFSSGANQFGRIDTPLTIDPWDPSKFALSALVLSRHAQPAKVPEGFDFDAPEDSVPLVADGVQITPTGSARFRKSDKCYLYVEVYEPAMAQPGAKAEDIPAAGVQVELLDPKTGNVKRDFGLGRVRVPPISGKTAMPLGLTLSISDLDAGDYKVRVTAVDAKDRKAVRVADLVLEN